MVSDDTEHTCLVAAALCDEPRDPARFAAALGRRVRWWALGVPVAAGWATVRASARLWLGFPATRSGVFSAGNGPAMRSAVLGAALDDLPLLREFVRASARVTHTDPKAFRGALAVAVAAWCSARGLVAPAEYFARLREVLGGESTPEFDALMGGVEAALEMGTPTTQFALDYGGRGGVSGYVYHTVPVALLVWLRHPRDCRAAIAEAVGCGGDADTLAAIVGGVVGSAGAGGVPADWLATIWEWPRGVAWMRRLAQSAARAVGSGEPARVPRVVPLAGLARNAVVFAAVMAHVVRRLLPPY